MSASLEARYKSQASMITGGFAALMILLMFLLKWKTPIFEELIDSPPGISIELENFPEIPKVIAGGGGGGGNPVSAPKKAGVSPPTPPAPGEKDESKDIETNENKDAPEITKSPVTKPTATKVVENTSVVKTPPKVIEPPAPKVPKTIYKGNTNTGNQTGGNESTTYQRNGGTNGTTGNGVGDGPGNGGGRGGGTGGGNGTGAGTGSGPRRISGSRVVINPKSMDAGENLKGKVFAEIRVSPDGIGSFVRTTRGSTYTSGEAISIIREWLRRNRFNKSDEESVVVYEFNFLLGG